MKIGILTYHRTNNFGGCLQALATRIVLTRMRHEVYYVDYWPEYHKTEYSLFNKNKYNNQTWRGKIRFVILFCFKIKNIIKRQRNFKTFLENFVTPYCKGQEEEYDIIIYGSDQIWRKQSATKIYNPIYFGVNNFKAKKHISFSASMGVLPKTEKEKLTIKEYIAHLDHISVREIDLQLLLQSLGREDTYLTIDPTLLLDASVWDNVLSCQPVVKENYLLIYSLWGDAFDMPSILKLAKRENLQIITVRGEAGIKDTNEYKTTAGPKEFVELIKGAKYVFASSFHGLAFSIIYRKEVFTSFFLNEGRAKSLLKSLGMEDRYIEPHTPFPIDFPSIDYDKVNIRLSKLKDQSIKYLTDSLTGI